ncbi:hypothetical protein [Paracraurococcus lichenis]|uniref:Tat pathway signal sequence domain protein n=1 Tax=Paracraurococcus lichenis TaxID=3064888 RepID=A0ABT9E428_9PROT|nr:hypothetical protein [Paracraurococcus sp. LOR1-02]MDO9710913.1 hypothetical protein [Paracraurococcus sp. LOR1-02]
MLRRALTAGLPGLLVLAALAPAAPAQSNDPSFRIVNNTSNVINEVYASPSAQQSWGHDRLGSEVVPPGGRQVVRLPQDGTCLYDVRVVYQGTAPAEERRNVNTCALTDLVFGGGGAAPREARQGNPSFNLVNQSGRVIEQFYASPSSQRNWGPDRLGDNTMVPSGQYYAIRLPQGECSYDIRVVWQGGQEQERRNVNTCTLTNYVVR